MKMLRQRGWRERSRGGEVIVGDSNAIVFVISTLLQARGCLSSTALHEILRGIYCCRRWDGIKRGNGEGSRCGYIGDGGGEGYQLRPFQKVWLHREGKPTRVSWSVTFIISIIIIIIIIIIGTERNLEQRLLALQHSLTGKGVYG